MCGNLHCQKITAAIYFKDEDECNNCRQDVNRLLICLVKNNDIDYVSVFGVLSEVIKRAGHRYALIVINSGYVKEIAGFKMKMTSYGKYSQRNIISPNYNISYECMTFTDIYNAEALNMVFTNHRFRAVSPLNRKKFKRSDAGLFKRFYEKS